MLVLLNSGRGDPSPTELVLILLVLPRSSNKSFLVSGVPRNECASFGGSRVLFFKKVSDKSQFINLHFQTKGRKLSPFCYYLILSPRGVASSRKITLTCSSPLANIIPLDSIPQSVAGLRLVTRTIFLPTSWSGV